MARYDTDERDIWRGVVVDQYTDDVDLLDYLRARSRADPEGI